MISFLINVNCFHCFKFYFYLANYNTSNTIFVLSIHPGGLDSGVVKGGGGGLIFFAKKAWMGGGGRRE